MRVFLIGGTSHVGKSTLAQSLAADLGWNCVSTDSLARHPGRPWKTTTRSPSPFAGRVFEYYTPRKRAQRGAVRSIPDHVARHYLTLSVDELVTELLRHYERLWPQIRTIIETATTDLIIEGSGLWPEYVAAIKAPQVTGVWLTASSQVLTERIRRESKFDVAGVDEQEMIRKFLGRTEQYNQLMMSAINDLALDSIDVSVEPSVEELVEACRSSLRSP